LGYNGSPNSNHNPKYASARGYYFDLDDWITIPISDKMLVPKTNTFEAWINYSDASYIWNYGTILGKNGVTHNLGENKWFFFIDHSVGIGMAGNYCLSSQEVSKNIWWHVAATCTDNGSTAEVRLYHNSNEI
jgi:hypothetical protein